MRRVTGMQCFIGFYPNSGQREFEQLYGRLGISGLRGDRHGIEEAGKIEPIEQPVKPRVEVGNHPQSQAAALELFESRGNIVVHNPISRIGKEREQGIEVGVEIIESMQPGESLGDALAPPFAIELRSSTTERPGPKASPCALPNARRNAALTSLELTTAPKSRATAA